MNLLVLGGRGMAGHMIAEYFRNQTDYTVKYTTRNKHDGEYFDAMQPESINEIIERNRPDYVINAIGILNEHAEKNKMEAIMVNSFLPHYLAKVLDQKGGTLIHISTDCVFSGTESGKNPPKPREGRYHEHDMPDGYTVYARTKALGEIHSKRHVTLRTSIIGPELKDDGIGLFHWFMKQKGMVNGYTNVYWNGVTTLELAKVIHELIKQNARGLYHITAPEIISKHDLLILIRKIFNKNDVDIQPYPAIVLNRTLKNTRKDLKLEIPSYPVMIQELYDWMEKYG